MSPMRLILAALAVAVPLAAAQTGCSLQLSSATIAFDRCLTIDGIGDNFVLYWTQNSSSTTWGMSTSSSSGYVAVGTVAAALSSLKESGASSCLSPLQAAA